MVKETNVSLNRIKSSKVKLRQLDPIVVEELARSIDKKGLLQPITLRETDDGYEIVFGEHRVAAFRLLGLQTIPAYVKYLDAYEALEEKIVENIHRNLFVDPVVEGQAYMALVPSKHKDISSLAASIGKSPQYVLDRMRIAQKLDPQLRPYIGNGLTISNILAICKDKPAEQITKARAIIDRRDIVKQILEKPASEVPRRQIVQIHEICTCPKCGAKHSKKQDAKSGTHA